MKDLCKYEHLENVSSFLYRLKIVISLLRHLNFFLSFAYIYVALVWNSNRLIQN